MAPGPPSSRRRESKGRKRSVWRILLPLTICAMTSLWVLEISFATLFRLGGDEEDFDFHLDLPPAGRREAIGVWAPAEVPAAMLDYPCAENTEEDTSICRVPCGKGGTCGNAWRSCESLVWCTDIVVSDHFAILKHDPGSMLYDASRELLEELDLPDTVLDATGTTARRRYYLLVSASKSLSALFAHFLTSFAGEDYVHRVYHVLDPNPPDKLSYKAFGSKESGVIQPDYLDSVRVLFLYGDPALVLAEEYGGELCLALRGDCADWWSPGGLEKLANAGEDAVGLSALYRAYLSPGGRFRYPIVAVNAEKVWDQAEALCLALGLPVELALDFQGLAKEWRKIKRRNESDRFYSHVAVRIRQTYAGDLMPFVMRMPAVKVIRGEEEGAPPEEGDAMGVLPALAAARARKAEAKKGKWGARRRLNVREQRQR